MMENGFELLACPVDGGSPLEVRPFRCESGDGRGGREIVEGILRCPICGRWYPVADGIPSLLPDALRGDAAERDFRDRWRDRIDAPSAPGDPSAGAADPVVADEQKKEIAKRDSESASYDAMYPDELNKTERRDYDALFSIRETDLLLDAGCGTGRLTKDYIGRCREIVGVDYSRQSLSFFRDRLPAARRASVHLVHAELGHLPLRSARFDRLLCSGVLCFLPWEGLRREALRGLSRVMVAGGIGVINVYHHSWAKRMKAALGRREANLREGYHSDGSCHYVNFTKAELRGSLSEFFEVRRIRGMYHRIPFVARFPRFSDRIDPILGRLRFLESLFANDLVAVVSRRNPGLAPEAVEGAIPESVR